MLNINVIREKFRDEVIKSLEESINHARGTMFFIAVNSDGKVTCDHMETNMCPEGDEDYLFSVRIPCNNDCRCNYDDEDEFVDYEWVEREVDNIMLKFDLNN